MPQNLFEPAARNSILQRLDALSPASTRQWGKMDAAQMLAHCSVALEAGTGDRPRKQLLIGKLLARLVRSRILGEREFSRNSPTDPTFVMTDARDFAKEKEYLAAVIGRFCAAGPAQAARHTHSFLGRMTGEEWGIMMYKHLDHHLRQFGT